MLTVIGKVSVLFAMIAIGVLAGKISLLTRDSLPHLNNLLLYICTPCMVLRSLYTQELSSGMLRSTLLTVLFAVIYFVVMTALTYAFIRMLKPEPREDWGTFICSTVAKNTGFMGYPISLALFGNSVFYFVVLQNMVLNIYCYAAEPILFNIGANGKTRSGSAFRSFFNFVTICMIAGFVMLLTGFRPPSVIDEVITGVSQITVPLSMIMVGLQLYLANIKEIVTKTNILLSLFNVLIIPVIFFLLIHPLPFLESDVKTALVFCAVMPSAVATMAMAQQHKKNSMAVSELISITTLMSLVTIPLSAMLLTALYR